jgi:hypothetical protein
VVPRSRSARALAPRRDASAARSGGAASGRLLVAEELPRLAAERPLEAVRLLRALLEREEAWFPDASRDEIERVLRIGYSSLDDATREFAYDTVNLLLGKGYRSFRAVLDEPGPTAAA